MEFVRKGKASKDPEKWKEHEAMMREYNIPEWYIGSCQKIKYMFPKAHLRDLCYKCLPYCMV